MLLPLREYETERKENIISLSLNYIIYHHSIFALRSVYTRLPVLRRPSVAQPTFKIFKLGFWFLLRRDIPYEAQNETEI